MPEKERSRKLEELFRLAVEVPTEERDRFLDRHCGADAELRARLVALLDQDEQPTGELLRKPVLAPEPKAEERIGRYRLIEPLGEGGMGIVYLAEQEEPIRRRVALKMVRIGAANEDVLARFETERQALAVMDHAGIARIYDGGMTESGLPYFVMEYFPGESLTAYCEKRGLTVNRRLKLFIRICEAVQHAHQKGVIHRDLKPSNVLVSERDGEPVSKIIDFGIARAVSGPLMRAQEDLTSGKTIGTFVYMSPEQADPSSEGVDTRTDIYSLGVMLYELLSGELPFDREALEEGGLVLLREQTPPLPSSRMSSSTAHARRLRGDLDWITMKAIERERSRRYSSASELAADVQRHLAHEPVVAGPPSTAYRVEKFVRRHRISVSVAGLVFLGLVVGIFVTTQAMRQARAAENTAEARLEEVLYQSEKAEAMVAFLWYCLFHASMESGELTVGEMFELSAPDVGRLFGEEPGREAAVHAMLGRVYLLLGENQAARKEYLEAYGIQKRLPGLVDELASLVGLIESTRRLEGREAAHSYVIDALDLARRIISERRPELSGTAESLVGVASGEDVDHDEVMRDLQAVLNAFPETLSMSDETVALGRLLLEAGGALRAQDRGESRAFFDALGAKAKDLMPEDDINYLTFLWMLATTNLQPGREDFEVAARFAEELLQKAEAHLPPEHWLRPDAKRVLAAALTGLGHLEEAERYLVQAYEEAERIPGRRSPRLDDVQAGLAAFGRRLAESENAHAVLRESWTRWRAAHAGDRRANSWWIVTRADVAVPLVETAVEMLAAEPESPVVLRHLGQGYLRAGRPAEALELLERAEDDDATALAFRILCLVELGRTDDADAETLTLRQVWRDEGSQLPSEIRTLLGEIEDRLLSK